jgi:2-oxoacid dehydrogenases acyltransferase (catalytic domain)
MKQGNDPDLALAKKLVQRLPRPALRVVLRAVSWAVGVRAWNIPRMGLRASPFGSVMVSSVGMFGVPLGFAPLVWMYRVPVILLAGEITDKAVVVSGRVEVEPIIPVGATADHRYVDGAHLGKALAAFKEYLEAPSKFEPPFEERASRTNGDGASASTPNGPRSPRAGAS